MKHRETDLPIVAKIKARTVLISQKISYGRTIIRSLLHSNFNRISSFLIPAKRIITMLGICILLTNCTQQKPEKQALDFEKEKAAIKAVIVKETESYYKQDFETWKTTYLQSPAFRRYGYWDGYPEKVIAVNGFEALAAEKKKQFEANETVWKGSTEERANENFRISDNMAWYTFEQYSYEKDSRKFLGKSLETRILEKVNGEWKIAYLGFHYFPLEKETK